MKLLFVLGIAMVLGGCSLFGGDDPDQNLSTSEQITPEPTANIVQAIPADLTPVPETDEAGAPLPTAVTLPPTPVPPEPTVDRSQPITYVVQAGDVLGLIAERFDVDIAKLREVNGLSGNLIQVGQELTIPAIEGTAPVDSAAPAATATPSSSSPSTPAAPVSCGGGVGHCIQPGDSLLGIAAQYGITVDALRAANPSIVGDAIFSGDLLTIPGGAAPDPAPTADGGGSAPTTPTVALPTNDAECAAANADFPYFHDGQCFANPVEGPTSIPTAQGADPDVVCPDGTFLWEDGLCYPVPGATVTVDPNVTPSVIATAAQDDYGSPPCRDGYVELPGTGNCWPEATNTAPSTVTPVPTATSTPS